MRYELANLGFSTADAECVRFALDCATLRLTYVDWQERTREVVFQGVCGMRWCEPEFIQGIRDDSTYCVHESEWIARLKQLGEDGELSHFVLCFNAVGVIEVICTGVQVTQ
jgi:hypothetical protein